jgi:hypothetical protein
MEIFGIVLSVPAIVALVWLIRNICIWIISARNL